LGIYLSAVAVMNYPSVERLARYLFTKVSPGSSERRSPSGQGRDDVQGDGTTKEEEDRAGGAEDLRGRWLVRFATRPDARLRLFCFPPAGAGAAVFRNWASLLPGWVDVCAVQLPGREERSSERSCHDLRLLLDALMEGPFRELDRPFALLGCSLGALIAYEVALRVYRERGVWPGRFFAVAFQHPRAVREQKSGVSERQWLELLLPEELRQNSSMTEELLPILRADIKLGFSWAAEEHPALGCPISAFAGSCDPIAGPSLEGWGRYSHGRFIHRVVPGGHRFAETHEKDFLPFLRQDIDALGAELPG
jgi:surfactin synthase thioesterase subunit